MYNNCPNCGKNGDMLDGMMINLAGQEECPVCGEIK